MSEQNELLEMIQDEALRGDASLQNIKSIDDLAKSYVQTKALVGKKGVILPGADAKDEDWGPVYNQLGRPEKPDGYKAPNFELPKGQSLRGDVLKEFNMMAHQIGMTQKQYERALEWRVKQELGDFEAGSKAKQEADAAAETELRATWKDKYDTNNAAVEKLIKTFGKDKADALLSKYGKNAEIKAFLGELLPNFNEATMEQAGYRPGENMAPEQAKAKIHEIRSDAKHPFNIANHPGHEAALKEMDKLYEYSYPGRKKI